jgi:radical SAM protein with 4Fe4S-binding SPASM domain
MLSAPIELAQIEFAQIEPVGQCNLRCQMCPIQFRKDGSPHGPLAFMDFGTFCRLIDEMPDLKELHLQGLGEPLMHPRFFDMVRYAVDRGVQVSTNSNLTLLSARRAELCVRSGLYQLHVSVDGASEQVYERIRVRGRLARVLSNLGHLREAKARLSSSLPHLRLVMVLMRQNLHELPDVVRLAHRHGIDTMFVQHLCHDFGEDSLPAEYQPMRSFVQGETLLGEDPQRIARYFSEAREAASHLGVDLRLPRVQPRPHPPGTPGRNRCDWPWHGPYISYQGYAMPCCMVSTPDRINFGNMAEQGVQALWSARGYQEFREALSSDQPPEVCRSCAVYHGTF